MNFLVDTAILTGSVLLLLGVLSNKISARLGMPALATFLGLGMLAGSEGIGGIEFEDYSLANAVGTVVLAIILFAGGLGTPISAVRDTWRRAGLLASVGVLLTAVITGGAASWILGLPIGQGMLLGSIVGSTDASAVFSVLRAGGVHIRRSLADTLEVESGSNDPMAIFMTVGMVQILSGKVTSIVDLSMLLVNQVVLGIAVGLAVGFGAVWTLKNIRLEVAGLYPIMAIAFGLISYGLAADFGGSGFLATYLTGIVIGNHQTPFLRGIQAFHDATAWLGQILMFILLGLLSFPSRLAEVWVEGLSIAAVLMFVARPISVFLCLIGSRFDFREQLLLSWVGLKGAVPITLAIFPLMANIEGASTIFNVVFFVVLISAVLQGSTLKPVAKGLGLDVAPRREPPVTLEISSLYDVDADIVDYYIEPETMAAGKAIRDLALPSDVVIALIVRNHESRLPKGSFRIEAGDHVIVVVHRDVRRAVDRIFSRSQRAVSGETPQAEVEFPLRTRVRVGDVEEAYDLRLGGESDLTLEEWLKRHSDKERFELGQAIDADQVRFRVRELSSDGELTTVSMRLKPKPTGTAPPLPSEKPRSASSDRLATESPGAETIETPPGDRSSTESAPPAADTDSPRPA
ncbi:MAG TPA: potassium/proton antiporter [Planctomycetaceae bacterium]|nr:potassium/proton antiporter [Planctomycetaceae bacterium]HRF01377.1 potassium/proton antiporter [Pirellulaceae bacterium]